MMEPTDLMARCLSGPTAGGTRICPGYKLIMDPLPHLRFRTAMYRMGELHQRRRMHGTGGGLLIAGPSGAGKSTVLRAYRAAYPRVQEAERTRIPVLLVTVPSSPTSRSLAGAILEALGHRNAHRGTAPEKTTWLHEFFSRCGIEMLVLDEFHHLFYSPTLSAFRDVTDWLKNFLEDTQVGMVGCGLPAAESVVNSNEQLARRFSERVRISPFSLDDAADFQEFRGILKALGERLPMPSETPLYEANLARRLLTASYGLMDYVVKVLEGAVSAASAVGLQSIDTDVLAAAFRDRVWRDVPERLNPFHLESPLRPLDRPGEVFHLHTRDDSIGSPVARRLGLAVTVGGR